MHVLYVIDSLTPAGAERSLAALAPHYAARGIDLDVAFLHDRPGLQEDLTRAGATLFCLAGRGGRAGWIQRTTLLAKRRRPDIIHTTLFEADVAGRLAGTITNRPVVSSLVNVTYGPEMLSDPSLRRWKVRGAQIVDSGTAQLVRRFHAVSNHVADVMAPRLRVPRPRIDVIPRGRDPVELGASTQERRALVRSSLGVDSSVPLLLAAARQERQKGLDVLLEAFAMLLEHIPRARLVIAGREGNQTPFLRAMLNRLRLDQSVRFLGNRTDVADLLCGVDLFVCPSRWEGFPGSVLEAMALQAPIIASDLPTVREAVGDGDAAWLAPPDRPRELAEALFAAIADPNEAHRRTQTAARRFHQHFTISATADAMVAFYGRALGGGRSS